MIKLRKLSRFLHKQHQPCFFFRKRKAIQVDFLGRFTVVSSFVWIKEDSLSPFTVASKGPARVICCSQRCVPWKDWDLRNSTDLCWKTPKVCLLGWMIHDFEIRNWSWIILLLGLSCYPSNPLENCHRYSWSLNMKISQFCSPAGTHRSLFSRFVVFLCSDISFKGASTKKFPLNLRTTVKLGGCSDSHGWLMVCPSNVGLALVKG